MDLRKSLFIAALIVVFSGCKTENKPTTKTEVSEEIFIDLDEIRERGKIRVVTDYNSTNYFVYKGKPMGYQFELLQALSSFLGLKLEISVSNDLEKNFEDLLSGKIDLIASNLAITRQRAKDVAFTESHCVTRQVLVQKISDKPNDIGNTPRFNEIIRNQLDLAGKTIYVQHQSAYADRLRSLSDEIGDSINVVEIPDYEVEQLIGLVANGEIMYTVCDENLAKVNLNFYNNIDIETAISFPQKIAWAVRPQSSDMLDAINGWLKGFKKTSRYNRIYKKYFLNKRSKHIVDAGYHSIKGGQVSEFDDIIRKESEKYALDWRLIASIIYQESRFVPDVESWAGAVGLMQLMPETAEIFGVKSITSPVDNIKGGIKFLRWLDKRLAKDISDDEERLKFVLAAYNVGIGHVRDAMALAEKNGKDSKKWNRNVDFYLLNKSNPEYYNDPVVKFGYCRGEEPYQYVTDILERYNHYKNVITD
ncbi:lytic transglycosylase F [Marinilabiliaceae bacterium JC017]|nr:lytic transglycosylase F [Marinilabiliaceae bacterium JC017]